MSLRDNILSTVEAMPSLPTSALDMVRLANEPETSVDELRRVIERDPGLTTNVLHLANSAFFGGSGHIGSVRDAAVRLGTRRIFQLALSSALAPVACSPVKGYDLPAMALLRHCVATAIASERLAKTLDRSLPDHAFTAGLLHDIGKIVLGTFIEVDAEPILALACDQQVPFPQAEAQILGMDHAEAGALLLEEWRLPGAIIDVVRWHHDPGRFPDADTFVVDLVHVADELGRMSGTGTGTDGFMYALSQEAVDRLGVTTRIAEEVVSDVLTDLDELSSIFGQGGGEE